MSTTCSVYRLRHAKRDKTNGEKEEKKKRQKVKKLKRARRWDAATKRRGRDIMNEAKKPARDKLFIDYFLSCEYRIYISNKNCYTYYRLAYVCVYNHFTYATAAYLIPNLILMRRVHVHLYTYCTYLYGTLNNKSIHCWFLYYCSLPWNSIRSHTETCPEVHWTLGCWIRLILFLLVSSSRPE